MAGLTAEGDKLITDHIGLMHAYTMPTVYAALVTGTLTAASPGTEVTTTQMTNYARQALTGANWGSPSVSGNYYASSYAALVDFLASTGGTGATVTGLVLFDAATGGNATWYETLSSSIDVSTGTHITFASGQITAEVTTFGNGGAANTGWSNTYASGIVGHMVGKTPLAQPAGVYVALCTTDCTATAIGTETTYTGYSSTRVSAGLAAGSAASPYIVYPASQLNFGAATSAATLVAFGLVDNATVGSGAYIAGGTISAGSVTSGTTPNLSTAQEIISQS